MELPTPKREAFVAAPEAHLLQDLRRLAGPPDGLAGQAAPAAGRRRHGEANPEPAHMPDTALNLGLAQQ
eukprot:6360526-Alexandrium_andersonii.AAC.1